MLTTILLLFRLLKILSISFQENSWFGAFVLFMSGFMSFFELAMHYTVLGPIIPILRDIYNDTYQVHVNIDVNIIIIDNTECLHWRYCNTIWLAYVIQRFYGT